MNILAAGKQNLLSDFVVELDARFPGSLLNMARQGATCTELHVDLALSPPQTSQLPCATAAPQYPQHRTQMKTTLQYHVAKVPKDFHHVLRAAAKEESTFFFTRALCFLYLRCVWAGVATISAADSKPTTRIWVHVRFCAWTGAIYHSNFVVPILLCSNYVD